MCIGLHLKLVSAFHSQRRILTDALENITKSKANFLRVHLLPCIDKMMGRHISNLTVSDTRAFYPIKQASHISAGTLITTTSTKTCNKKRYLAGCTSRSLKESMSTDKQACTDHTLALHAEGILETHGYVHL